MRQFYEKHLRDDILYHLHMLVISIINMAMYVFLLIFFGIILDFGYVSVLLSLLGLLLPLVIQVVYKFFKYYGKEEIT